jgi:hypothetical protein
MSPQVKTVAKTAAIGAGVVGVVVVATKVVKSIRHHVNDVLFPTTEDVLGCASEQPFVSSMHQEKQPAVQ